MVNVQRVMSTLLLVGLDKAFYRCMTCGSDLRTTR